MTAQDISWWGFVVVAVILLGFAALTLWKFFWDADALRGLILEPPLPGQDPEAAKASLSRFQFLIFTFVIAGLYLLLSIEAGTFVDIPGNVLGLLGISGGTYIVSKGVTASERNKVVDKTPAEALARNARSARGASRSGRSARNTTGDTDTERS